jgi:hypothetical protein
MINEATLEMANFREDLKLNDPRLIEPVREFAGDATVVMQTIFPNVIVQQQSNTLAMRQIVTRGPLAFDLNWTFFGFKDDAPELRQTRIRQNPRWFPGGFFDCLECAAGKQLLLKAAPSEFIAWPQLNKEIGPNREFPFRRP